MHSSTQMPFTITRSKHFNGKEDSTVHFQSVTKSSRSLSIFCHMQHIYRDKVIRSKHFCTLFCRKGKKVKRAAIQKKEKRLLWIRSHLIWWHSQFISGWNARIHGKAINAHSHTHTAWSNLNLSKQKNALEKRQPKQMFYTLNHLSFFIQIFTHMYPIK